MKIKTVDHRGIKVVIPSGDIDMYTSPLLRKTIMDLINRKITPLVVDLCNVSYIDSSGIATFFEGLKCMKDYNGRLVLVSIPENIMEVFTFSNLEKVFEIHSTIDVALQN
jgi:anti-sigma B factor antagonist